MSGYLHLVAEIVRSKNRLKAVFTKNMKIYRPLWNLATVPGIDAVRANVIIAIVRMRLRKTLNENRL